MTAFYLGLFITVIGILYFIPVIVSVKRNHHNMLSIFVLNLLLGWTVIGYIIALIWSCSATSKLSTSN